MDRKQLDALEWFFSTEGASLLEENLEVAFLGAEHHPVLKLFQRDLLTCYQSEFQKTKELRAAGFNLSQAIPEGRALTIISGSKHRAYNELLLQEASKATPPSGKIVFSLDGKVGGKAFAKRLSESLSSVQVFSKAHCKVVLIENSELRDISDSLFDSAQNTLEVSGTSYTTHPSLFSWDESDTGSLLLLKHIPTKISGVVGDLGCGWGLLGFSLLKENPAVTELHLFDSNRDAIEAVEKTIERNAFEKVSSHWANLKEEQPDFSGTFDFIASNLPYHEGNEYALSLQERIVTTAHSMLRESGNALFLWHHSLPDQSKPPWDRYSKMIVLERNSAFFVVSVER